MIKPNVAHRGWPVTEQDLAHIEATPQFIDCGANPIPTLDVGAVTRQPGADLNFVVSLSANRGCVSNIAVESYGVFWEVTYDSGPPQHPTSTISTSSYGTMSATFPPPDFTRLLPDGYITSIRIVITKILPTDYEYGLSGYLEPQGRIVYGSGSSSN